MNLPQFENTYTQLPSDTYSAFAPDPVSDPSVIRVNDKLAQHIGIDPDWLSSNEGLLVLAGNETPVGSTPIATAYGGHQFGQWNPGLGDGRAVLLGELVNPAGERFDIQLKGSGPTRYSRGGDGRAPIGPVLREYIVAEAMAALGVPTTRALAAVATGDPVYRESSMPGGVLTRVAQSHMRVGTVQFFSMAGPEPLRQLLDYVIERHYPNALEEEHPYLALLAEIQKRQANLVAQWQSLGFIHGVMNTDNMLLCGETVDYGPCAFLDAFDPAKVYSSIDQGGRYAYQNQPTIAHWNICRLAEAMLPAIDSNQDRAIELATGVIENFSEDFDSAWNTRFAMKLGVDQERGADIAKELLQLMAEASLDFTLTFRTLTERASGQRSAFHLDFPPALGDWLERWEAMTPDDAVMKQVNPSLIPRNHRIEAVIQAAIVDDNLEPFHEMVDVLSDPYTDEPSEAYSMPPLPQEEVRQTFCGT